MTTSPAVPLRPPAHPAHPAHPARALRARGLGAGYGERRVLEGLDLDVPPGAVTAIVGANASGKSTLLKALAGLIPATAGSVTLDGHDIAHTGRRALARMLGLLPQTAVAPEGVGVAELVGRGRYPHRGLLGRWSRDDQVALERALDLTRTRDLADRPVDQLSGGQLQRVWIAMALAQDPDVLLLDEPTTYLDLAHQVEVLEVVRELNRTRGTTVCMVLHELNLAARYADHLVVMREGTILRQGVPDDVLTEQVVAEAFGLPVVVVADPVTGGPLVVPLGRHPAGTGAETPGAAPVHTLIDTKDEGHP